VSASVAMEHMIPDLLINEKVTDCLYTMCYFVCIVTVSNAQ